MENSSAAEQNWKTEWKQLNQKNNKIVLIYQHKDHTPQYTKS